MLDPKTIKAMVAAGVSAEQLAAAVLAEQEADHEKRLALRAEWRERQRRRRANQKEQQNQQSCHGDIVRHRVTNRDIPSPLSPPSFPDKEKVSIPLKEINLSTPLNPPTPFNNNIRISEFEQLWKIYPNKKSKKASLRAFLKARKTVSLTTITDALYAYIEHNPDPAFQAHLSTWLNAERWTDEYSNKIIRPDFPAKPLTARQQILKHNMELAHAFANGSIPHPDHDSPAAGHEGRQVASLPALGRPVAKDVSSDRDPFDTGTAHSAGDRHGTLL